MHRVFDRAKSLGALPERRLGCGLPLFSSVSAPRSSPPCGGGLISRLNTGPARTPANASPAPSRTPTHDLGPVWGLVLHRMKLSFTTPCRFNRRTENQSGAQARTARWSAAIRCLNLCGRRTFGLCSFLGPPALERPTIRAEFERNYWFVTEQSIIEPSSPSTWNP